MSSTNSLHSNPFIYLLSLMIHGVMKCSVIYNCCLYMEGEQTGVARNRTLGNSEQGEFVNKEH